LVVTVNASTSLILKPSAISCLAALTAGEDGLGVCVEVDTASTVLRLARDLDAVPANGLSCAGDRYRMGAAFPVAQRSPASSPRRIPVVAARYSRRVQAEVLGGGEEVSELVGRPRFGSLLGASGGAGCGGAEGDVVFDEMDPHGVFQCGAHDDVDVASGGRFLPVVGSRPS
jgi:hypothetical protein